MSTNHKISRLLINEPPLMVSPTLAKIIGLNEAIALQQLHYWLENPRAGMERNGYKWIFNTIDEWQETNFPFWSVKTVQRVWSSLVNQGLVIVAQLDAHLRDMRNFYRIDYDVLDNLEEVKLTSSNRSHSTVDKVKKTYSKRTHRPDVNIGITESSSTESDDDGAMTDHERFLYIRRLYVANVTSRIVPIMDAILLNFSKTYTDPVWYEKAFEIYVSNNAGSWTYIERICENWTKNGFGSPAPSVNGYKKNAGMTGTEAAKILQGG